MPSIAQCLNYLNIGMNLAREIMEMYGKNAFLYKAHGPGNNSFIVGIKGRPEDFPNLPDEYGGFRVNYDFRPDGLV